MKKTLVIMAATIVAGSIGLAQEAGKTVALEVGKTGGPMLFVTTPPMGGLAATAKVITPREVFRIENTSGAEELKDGDSVRIHYLQSTWVEQDEAVRRVEVRNAKPEVSTFKVKAVGAAYILQTPSGKFVTSKLKEALTEKDVRALLTSPDEGEAMQITPHWNPQPEAAPVKP